MSSRKFRIGTPVHDCVTGWDGVVTGTSVLDNGLGKRKACVLLRFPEDVWKEQPVVPSDLDIIDTPVNVKFPGSPAIGDTIIVDKFLIRNRHEDERTWVECEARGVVVAKYVGRTYASNGKIEDICDTFDDGTQEWFRTYVSTKTFPVDIVRLTHYGKKVYVPVGNHIVVDTDIPLRYKLTQVQINRLKNKASKQHRDQAGRFVTAPPAPPQPAPKKSWFSRMIARLTWGS